MKRFRTDADFPNLSWHDNSVHAFRVIEGEDGAGAAAADRRKDLTRTSGHGLRSAAQCRELHVMQMLEQSASPRISIPTSHNRIAFR
jgi:hypothetical protein